MVEHSPQILASEEKATTSTTPIIMCKCIQVLAEGLWSVLCFLVFHLR